MAVTDVWADWSSTAASNSPAGAATPEVDDELRNIKAQCKGNVPAAAAQSDQETATSTTTYVSPGRQKFHPSAAKAWAYVSSAGVLQAGYNVTSQKDDTGKYTVAFAVNFSSTAYAVLATVASGGIAVVTGLAVNHFHVETYSVALAATDIGFHVVCFGDQ